MGTNLGDLLSRVGFTPSAPEQAAPPAVPVADRDADGLAFAPKVVVRASRKGRGGKTVTTVQGVHPAEPVLERLRKELGVGGRVEGEELVLQGDQVERVARWLESRGARKVVRSR